LGFYRGLIATPENALEIVGEASAADEYRFLRKYFSPLWGIAFLVVRCLCFFNPLVELRGFLRSRSVARVDVWSHLKESGNFEQMDLRSNRKVSVVIPTLNRYEYLKDALHDLEAQTYKNFEVIVIDQSQPYRESFYAGFELDIHLIRQEEPGLWKARNSAVRSSRADAILLFDDDSRVDADWIAQHLGCIDAYSADISSGVSLSTVGDRVPESYRNYRQADQLDTGNALVNRNVFEAIGLFDEQFEGQRMGDSEFGLRAYLAGFKIVSSPDAKRVHLKVESGGLRQMGSWDAFRPKSLLAPRPVPSVLYLLRKYFGNADAMKAIVVLIPPSVVPYRLKANRLLRGIAYVGAVLLSPLLFLQAARSWREASCKLREGARIPVLDS
jgi:glycosyltransferase involved in cell wall biosynthesis